MLHELSSDQEFFRETTRRFLETECPITAVRALREDADGFDRKYWRQGCELGWTSLLVSEDHGGGSISGRGLVDLTLVAYEFGKHASPGPLLGSNIVAAALSRSGSADGTARTADLEGLISGEAIGAWAYAESPPHDRLGATALTAQRNGDDFVLNGVKRPVDSGGQATLFLVTARTSGGLTQFVVPAGTTGVSVFALHSLDLTRRYAEVRFENVTVPATAVVGSVDGASADVEHQIQLAAVVQSAETTGAMDAGFEMTVEWAFNRYSFGRPLAAYQEVKHRFADMKMWLEASHAIADTAAAAVQEGARKAAEMASAAKAYVGEYGPELLQDCVQLHGGIGVTFDHDLHLFLRRATVNRSTFGSPAEHRERLTQLVESRKDGADHE